MRKSLSFLICLFALATFADVNILLGNRSQRVYTGTGTNLVASWGSAFVSATGGTITYDGDYKIHTFTSSDTFTVINGGICDVLVVAGGGAGGAAGGGAGGFVYEQNKSITAGDASVTVGAGENSNLNGGDSSIFDINAVGGGRGAWYNGSANDNNNGANGGSGGGGFGYPYPVWHPGDGVILQGNAGGYGDSDNATYSNSGGGGGAGSAGGDSGPTYGGEGGIGVACSITGESVYYCGGGGGAAQAGTGGIGGLGGGGSYDQSGADGLGGGGGGVADSSSSTSGGSGIVIIRYKYK